MYREKDLDELEFMPTHESQKEYLTRNYSWMFSLKKFDNPGRRSEKSDYPSVKAFWVINKNIGKSFDLAFRYYCKLVKKNEQSVFLEHFRNNNRWYGKKYIIDQNNNIQINEDYLNKYKRKTNVEFFSFDYKTGYIDSRTGKIYSEFEGRHYNYSSNERFHPIVLSGFHKRFDSRKDKEYIKLKVEDDKKRKLEERKHKKYLREKKYSFETNAERLKRKEPEKCLQQKENQ